MLTALSLGLATQAYAWPWPFPSSSAIGCEPRDRACILEETIKAQIDDLKTRNDKLDMAQHAQGAAELYPLVPEAERELLTMRWLEAGAEEDFFDLMESYRAPARLPLQDISAADLRAVLEKGIAPDDRDFDSYVREAFPVVLAADKEGGIALWEDYRSLLHRDAFRAFSETLDWASQHDIDALERYTADYLLPKTAYYDGWDRISRMAARLCNAGDSASGERLLAILESEKADWTVDQEMQAIQWSKMTSGVLHCRGEKAARRMLDPLFDQMQADIEQVRQLYPDEREQNFNIGVIRSEVAENAVQVIALWLHEQDRTEEGRELFASLPSTAMSSTLSSIANEGIYGSTFEDNSFDQMIEFQQSAAMYDENPLVALGWYVEDFNPDLETCCIDKDYVTNSIDLIEQAWPADIARDAARLTIGYLEQLEVASPRFNGPHQRDLAMLRIATLARASDGCDLTDEYLSQILARVPSYEFGRTPGDVLRSYLRFLDTEAGAGQAGCDVVQAAL